MSILNHLDKYDLEVKWKWKWKWNDMKTFT